jgi:hypothetical protein
MAAEPVTVSMAPPERASMDYALLREDGMRLIRDWASEGWTDHNVHDPGITILEACSYAMTELGLRLQLDVADLMRSGERHAAPDLEPAHRVLPVGPVTPQDLRALLLDHPLVSEAQIFLPADNEVPFYEREGATPPLTFTAGSARGLYEVLVELADRPLNSNTYSLNINVGTQSYAAELGLPFWDDIVAAAFRDGVTINSIAMVPDGAEVWRALPEPQSYFGRLNVGYTGTSGPGSVELWTLLFIAEDLAQPSIEIPQILTAAQTAVQSTAAGAPLAQFNTRVRGAARAVDQLRCHVSGWRNLGEQAVRIGAVRVQEIAVRARIEVTGGIDVEQLLATLVMDFDQMLSPLVRFESLADRRAVVDSAERIYEGPLLRHGFPSAESLGTARPDVLYTSDVLRLIMRRRAGSGEDLVTQENPVGRDIVAVTDLALSNFINNRPIIVDADNCLLLVDVSRYRPRLSIAKSHIVLARNDAEVVYDLARVVSLFDELLLEAGGGAATTNPSPVWPVPRGELLPVDDYTPLQEELPATYGVGRAELPDSAPPERHAAARQLRGYLLVFEQFLGDLTAQLGNVNRFFSIDGDEDVTYFTRPPFDLPAADKLLRRFPGGSWQAFISDPANPVARALRDAAEDAERRLDRRNRMLDHRLARHGEDAVALGQELHRWARQELVAGEVPVTPTPESIAARRKAANARLVRIKAAFVDDVPELNAFRLLARGNPFHRDTTLMRVEPAGASFRWVLALQGQDLLRAHADLPSSAAAGIAAENAFAFAGRAAHYRVAPAGGAQELRLMDGDGTSAAVLQIAESVQRWPSVAAANNALKQISEAFAALRIESSTSPMERRIAHLSAIRLRNRRPLLAATRNHFEIIDDPPGGTDVGRRWRLWSEPGNTGQQLLLSPARIQAGSESEVMERVRRSIESVLRFGMDEWNYRITPPPGTPLTFQLMDPAGAVIASNPAPLASAEAVAAAMNGVVEFLYRVYGAEGCLVVEHLLLRPLADGQPFLALPISPGPPNEYERDPYSQRISFVLPSGFARDFADVAFERVPATPDRFRDLESRRHIERMIRQSCPAHLLPTVYWVDREAGGAPTNPASFDSFEQRYFAWLDTVLIPGAPAATVDAARANLAGSLNAIANDAL